MSKFRVYVTDTNRYSRLVEAESEEAALAVVRGPGTNEDDWGEFMDGATDYDVVPVRDDSV